MYPVFQTGHVLAVLGAALAIAVTGRFAARRCRQPEVIGELTAGLLAGPLAVWLLGGHTFAVLVPAHVLASLKLTAEIGVVLFLVGLTHKLRVGSIPAGRAVGCVAAGALLPALAAGVLFASLVLATGGRDVRGTAPTPALVLMLAVTMSITAVPVLARILTDRGLSDTDVGRLTLTAAIVIDASSWVLLSVAIGLTSRNPDRFLRSMTVLGCGVAAAFLLRLVLRGPVPSRLCQRAPWAAAPLIGGVAVVIALVMEHTGMTAIVGAALSGLAVPLNGRWGEALSLVTRAGRALLPVFFVVSGVTVLTKAFGTASVVLIAAATLTGIVGKAAGGYLGARFGARSQWDSLRVGALMNTRGLTELVVLQAGYSARILTAPVYLALVVMALVTTAMTGPSLLVIDRAEMRHRSARTQDHPSSRDAERDPAALQPRPG